MVWFGNRTPVLNTRGLGFNFKHYKRQIKTKDNWHRRPDGWKGSLEQSSRGQAGKLGLREGDSSGDDIHPCDADSNSKPIFKNIFLTKIFITFHSFPRNSVLVRISIAVMKYHDQKKLGEKRVYLYTSISLFVTEGSQGRILEAGADEEAVEGAAYRLASHGLLSLLSYRLRSPAQGWHGPQWVEPSHISSCPTGCLQRGLTKAFSELKHPPFKWF